MWLREKQETRNKIETCGKPERALAKGWVWGGEAEQTDSWLMEAERPGPEELREGGCMAKGLRSGNLRLRGRWEPVALGRKPGPDAADGTPEERHRRRGDAEGPGGKRRLRLLPRLRSPRSSLRFRSWCRGLEAALAFTLARCTPPFARRLRRGPPLQCASAGLAQSRDDAVSREVRADALRAQRSPPAPPSPPCSGCRGGVIEPAVARADLPERAEGRAQIGPTPPHQRSPRGLRRRRASRKKT